jgi:hypothetical protein
MADQIVKGFLDTWGIHGVPLVEHKGPSKYTQGGETLTCGTNGYFGARAFAFLIGGITYSGTYRVEAVYGGAGLRATVKLYWTNVSTGQQVANNTNLSGETVRLLVVAG